MSYALPNGGQGVIRSFHHGWWCGGRLLTWWVGHLISSQSKYPQVKITSAQTPTYGGTLNHLYSLTCQWMVRPLWGYSLFAFAQLWSEQWSETDLFKTRMPECLQRAPLQRSTDFQYICYSDTHMEGKRLAMRLSWHIINEPLGYKRLTVIICPDVFGL